MTIAYMLSDEIVEEDHGSKVTVRGWVQDIRNLGGISFIVLRDRSGTLQLTLPKKRTDPDVFGTLTTISRESVVEVTGTVKGTEQTDNGYEILPEAVRVLNIAETPLPMGVVDKVSVEMDTRLNNRFMDLRKPEIRAVFELKSLILDLLGGHLRTRGFLEVNTPKMVGSGAEGGATLFQIEYFGQKAYLAQSPQLYKQMLMSTGIDRVFEVSPAFRAEPSDTVRHVSEFISFDGEMAFIEHQEDVMDEIELCTQFLISGVMEEGKHLLDSIGAEVTMPRAPYPHLTYTECLDMINDNGLSLPMGADLGTEGEKMVGEIMKERGYDMYWIKEYPEAEKPFYIMEKEDTPFSYSFDLDYRGQEISSGGQREHRPEVLAERMRKKGLDPVSFNDYMAAFRFGMPPHGGWGLGLERFVVKMLDLPNIREAILFPRDRNRLTP